MSNTIMPTVNTTGVRRLSTLGGWGLGTAVDQSTIADLVANGGYDMGTINNLVSLGASNEQLLALPYPASQQEMQSAVAALTFQLTPPAPSPAPLGPPSSNILRAGSQLSYTATWGRGSSFANTNWNDPNGIQNAIQGILANQWGVIVDSQFHTTSDILPNVSGKSGFTLQVHTTRDYGSAADVKSIIDGALSNLGLPLQSSTIALTVSGVSTVPVGPIPGAAGSQIAMQPNVPVGAWLQQNAGWVLFGLAVIVIGPPLIKKL